MSRIPLLLPVLLLASWTPLVQAEQAGPLTHVQTIPLPGVEGRIDHLAVDVPGRRLFLSALGNNTLEVLDLKRGQVARSIRGLREPQGVAFAPDLDRLFVGNGEGASCSIFQARAYTPAGHLAGLDDADNVRYDAAAKRVWVGYGAGALLELDGATGKRLGEVRLKAHPESFQLEQGGSRIFVNLPGAGHVAVVDRRRRAVTSVWPLRGASANFPMALDEADHRLLVGCRRPARMLVFDTNSGREVASEEIAGDTDDLWYDAARRRVYASCGEGFLSVLAQNAPDHYSSLARIPTAPGARTCLFSPDLGRLYLAAPHRGSQRAEVRVYTVHP